MVSEILKRVNWADCLIIVLLIRCWYVGLKKGLFGEIFRSLGIIAALILSLYNCGRLGNFLSDHSFLPLLYSGLLSFIALFIFVLFIFRLLRFVTEKLMKVEFGPRLNGVGGALLGLARGTVIGGVILLGLSWLPSREISETINQRSYLGPSLIKVVPTIYDGVMGIYPESKLSKSEEIFEKFEKERAYLLKERARSKNNKIKK